jgi:hypothetical protein
MGNKTIPKQIIAYRPSAVAQGRAGLADRLHYGEEKFRMNNKRSYEIVKGHMA